MRITLDNKLCIQPDAKYAGTKAEGRANGYWCPVGPLPGRAWVLMSRANVDAIKAIATHALKFNDTSFGPLYWQKATRVFVGGEGATQAAFMVELADRRFVMQRSSLTAQYNLRHHAPPATSGVDRYMGTSLNGGALWTWQTMLADIWGNLPGAPAAPTLPYTPHGTPENWHFLGVSAWDALHVVLHKLLCTTAYDPIANTFSFVQLGAAQDSTPSQSRLLYSAEPIETDVDIPATVRVHFHTHYLAYGQERDTERTTNWATDAYGHVESKATGVAAAVSGTAVDVWDDLVRELGEDNTVTNSGALSSRATEIKNNLVTDWQTPQRLRHWQLIKTDVLPGARVKAVLWRNHGHGTATEIVEHPGLPKPPGGTMCCDEFSPVCEQLGPPDLGRATFPVYPRLENIVEIFHDTTAGASVTENASGFHPGRVRRWVAGALAILDDCWIKLLGAGEGTSQEHKRFVARLSGIATVSTDTRRRYVAVQEVTLPVDEPYYIEGTLDDDVDSSSDATFDITVTGQYGPGPDLTSQTITVNNPQTGTAGQYFYGGKEGETVVVQPTGTPDEYIVTSQPVGRPPFVEATLNADVPTTDATFPATVTGQYGPGSSLTGQTITITNPQTGTPGDYLYAGKQGDTVVAQPDGNGNYVATAPPADGFPRIEGYLTGQLSKAETFKQIEVSRVYGRGYSVGDLVAVVNPPSRVTGTGIFEGQRNAWGKASLARTGEVVLDVLECPVVALEDQYYQPYKYESSEEAMGAAYGQYYQEVAALAGGGFGGGAVAGGTELFEFLAMNARERAELPYEEQLALREAARIARGAEKAKQREGATDRAADRYYYGMQNAFAHNVALSAAIHGTIHNSWANYTVNMQQFMENLRAGDPRGGI